MSNVSLVDGHIDEPKMTDKEIMKALECCGNIVDSSCKECAFHETYNASCVVKLMQNTLNLINRKDAEIDILKAEIERYKGVIRLLEKDIAEARTDGVKDFAKFLIDKGTELNTFDLCDYVPEFLERKEGE